MPRLVSALLLLLLVANVPTASGDESPPPPAPPVVVDLLLKGSLTEGPTPTGLDGAPIGDSLKETVDRILKARDDKDVRALLVRVHGLSIGLAKGNELRQAIRRFRDGGKKVYAFLESAENADYLVATAADEIVLPESGWLMLKGLAAEVTFYKALFDKIGVSADWMQVGEFKSYGEPFTRTRMSPAFREEITALLGDSLDLMAESIAARQGITREDARALIDGGPYSPTEAKKNGLVNRISYTDQMEAAIAADLKVEKVKLDTRYGKTSETIDLSGFAGFMKMMQMLSGETGKKANTTAPKLALIYASGPIDTGKSTTSLMGESTIGSDTLIKHLRQAERDKTVKAIVLRVDSPGGSALASDLIWREVTRIEKPIVASMSDVAASGGYYISMGADRIFAEPGTLTGSIGVTGGKFVLSGLMDKLGVSTDTVTVGKNGTIFSLNQPFSEAERAAMKRLMDDTYRQFVQKAADGRKMPYDQLEKLAGGRVYTGRQAQKLGLVDEVGTLEDALLAARKLGNLPTDAPPELLVLPKSQGLLESLIAPIEDRDVMSPALRAALPESARGLVHRLEALRNLFGRERVGVILPFDLRIH